MRHPFDQNFQQCQLPHLPFQKFRQFFLQMARCLYTLFIKYREHNSKIVISCKQGAIKCYFAAFYFIKLSDLVAQFIITESIDKYCFLWLLPRQNIFPLKKLSYKVLFCTLWLRISRLITIHQNKKIAFDNLFATRDHDLLLRSIQFPKNNTVI